MYKILGNQTAVNSQLGLITEGIGFPLRPVDDTATGGVVISAPRQLFDAEEPTDQVPTAQDVEQRITFGPQIVTPECTVAANGVVTTHVAATFKFRATFSLQRNSNPQSTITPFRFKKNGVQVSTPLAVRLTDSDTIIPFQFESDIVADAGDEYDLWFYRDSLGNNDGSLVALNTTLYGMAASAGLTVSIYEAQVP